MEHSSLLVITTHILDFVLVASAVWMALAAAKLRLGGALNTSVNRIVVGAIILGLAHMVETLCLQYGMDENINELLHRVIILAGFVALTLGIQSLVSAFGKTNN